MRFRIEYKLVERDQVIVGEDQIKIPEKDDKRIYLASLS